VRGFFVSAFLTQTLCLPCDVRHVGWGVYTDRGTVPTRTLRQGRASSGAAATQQLWSA